MGKNAPGNEKKEEGKDDENGVAGGKKSQKGKASIIVVFRSIFD